MESLLKNKAFFSKILLFGEYSLIRNSMALTVPYINFYGRLNFRDHHKKMTYEQALTSNLQLLSFQNYLTNIYNSGTSLCKMDLDRMIHDIRKGLFFDSSIPQGYGLGSSGALVAAIVNEYCSMSQSFTDDLHEPDNLRNLKRFFSELEAYFHGTSSGLDPLLAYIGKPIVIRSQGEINTTSISWSNIKDDIEIFLIDTKITGPTRPLVERFLEKLNDDKFRQMVDENLTISTNQCIESLLQLASDSFFLALENLSRLQIQHFKPMISKDYMDIWKAGLDSGLFTLKLCGSGGGGYLLGFTRERRKTTDFFRKHGIKPLYVIDDLL